MDHSILFEYDVYMSFDDDYICKDKVLVIRNGLIHMLNLSIPTFENHHQSIQQTNSGTSNELLNEKVRLKIDKSKYFMCFTTEVYIKTKRCMNEYKYAYKRNKPIIFAIFETIEFYDIYNNPLDNNLNIVRFYSTCGKFENASNFKISKEAYYQLKSIFNYKLDEFSLRDFYFKRKLFISYYEIDYKFKWNFEYLREINSFMTNCGYHVWLNDNEWQKIGYQILIDVIDDCDFFIVFLTSLYQINLNCQLEIEYAIEAKKKVIAIITEADYRPNDWAKSIFQFIETIDFTKYELKQSVNQLYKAVLFYDSQISKSVNASSDRKRLLKNNTNKPAILWNENEVNNWLASENFNYLLKLLLNNFNGSMLYNYYISISSDPNKFYSQMMLVDFNEAEKFLKELKHLFSNIND